MVFYDLVRRVFGDNGGPAGTAFLKTAIFICFFLLTLTVGLAAEPQRTVLRSYHHPDEVLSICQVWEKEFPHLTKVFSIGKSAGQHELTIVRIAAETVDQNSLDYRPAVFVCANIEGVHLLGTEAALYLGRILIDGYGRVSSITKLLDQRTVYLMPLMNPDAAERLLHSPHFSHPANSQPVDDDRDGKLNEDPPDDLNRDGFITQMRVHDPKGKWTNDPADPRLMRLTAKPAASDETYSLYIEGLDDDEDGNYNEDPDGGIQLNRNFPSYFQYHSPDTSIQPDSSSETAAIVTFLAGHPNISLVLNFSLENTLLGPADYSRLTSESEQITLPENLAEALGVDPSQTFRLSDLAQIFEQAKLIPGKSNMDDTELARLFGLSPVTFFEERDVEFITSVQDDYKKQLRKANLTAPVKTVTGAGKGSFLNFCYFHLGLPAFSANLYLIPADNSAPADKPTDGDAGFLKLGEAFKSESFIDWRRFDHPQLGRVEIGGFNPVQKFNPPLPHMKDAVAFQTDFYLTLMNHLPELKIENSVVNRVNGNYYQVTVRFSNPGWFPTFTAYGAENLRTMPIIVRLKTSKDQMIYSGEPFEVIDRIGARSQSQNLQWTIKAAPGSKMTLTADSPKIGHLEREIVFR